MNKIKSFYNRIFGSEILFSDILEISWQRFRLKRLRTFLTVLGIGVGIGTVYFLVSLTFGLQKLVIGNLANSDTLLTLDVFPNMEVKNIINLNETKIEKMSKIKGVEKISAIKSLSGEVNMNKIKTQTTVNGVDQLYFKLSSINPKTGEIFTDEQKDKAVVSSAILSLYGIKENQAIGKKFRLSFIITPEAINGGSDTEATNEALLKTSLITIPTQFTIVGVIDDTANYIYIHRSNFSVVDIDEYKSLKIKALDKNVFEPIREKVIELGYTVNAMTDTLAQIDKIFQATQVIFTVIGVIALFVAAIGMFNTMTIALLERTREIGIMKAIGATEKAIYHMFLTESIIMGVGGSIFGLLFGFIATFAFNIVVNTFAVSFGGKWTDLFYTPLWFIIMVLLFGLGIGLVTGFFPARRASKLNPLMALRYE